MKKQILKYWPHLLLALFVGLITLILDAGLNIAMMRTIDIAMNKSTSSFSTAVIWLLGLTAALLPLNVVLAYAKARYKRKTMVVLKSSYLSRVFNKDISEFHADHAGDYVSAVTQDMNTIENGYVTGLFEVVFSGLSFIVGIGVIAYVNPLIPLVSVIIAAVVGILSALLGKPVQKQQKRRSELFTHYTNYISSALSAFHIIKVNQLTEKAKGDFFQKSQAVQQQGFIIDKLNTYIFAMQNILMSLIMVGILGFSVYLTLQGKMTFGGTILVINSAEKVFGPLMAMGEWLPKMTAAKILFDKMDKQLSTTTEEAHITEIAPLSQKISLQNISFSFGDTNILKNVNLDLIQGQKYLVVGPSGGGKSTLLRLLRKYYKPESGTISYDGHNLNQIQTTAYFKHIANVEQHVFLFEDTLKNNLTLYKDVAEADLMNAIDKAGLSDLVSNLPNGLESMIVDNGRNLSGGEKSRIAIARGLLQKASILLLDEAFSSLDDGVAKRIEETLLALNDVTVINVTHVVFPETAPLYSKCLTVSHRSVG